MSEQKQSWEKEFIARCLMVGLAGGVVAMIGMGLVALTGLQCFLPIIAIGFIVAIIFGIFGLVGLVVEGGI